MMSGLMVLTIYWNGIMTTGNDASCAKTFNRILCVESAMFTFVLIRTETVTRNTIPASKNLENIRWQYLMFIETTTILVYTVGGRKS